MELTPEVIIVGGGKTAFNLYNIFKKNHVDNVKLYYFGDEYVKKKGLGLPFAEVPNARIFPTKAKVFITSETAFNSLDESDQEFLSNHYFLRDKLNLNEIVQRIAVNDVTEIDINSSPIEFPIAVKPKQSASKVVPFKFKVVSNIGELNELRSISDLCLFQKYLSPNEYKQVAIAGFFTGTKESLVAVEQLNQYPTGISSYVKRDARSYNNLILQITEYLNSIGFKGFVEFEFKVNRENENAFLLDINPRTWGWFYFFIEGVKNIREVLLNEANPVVEMKNAWVNLPRLIMSNVTGRIKNPSIFDVVKNKIVYEPN